MPVSLEEARKRQAHYNPPQQLSIIHDDTAIWSMKIIVGGDT